MMKATRLATVLGVYFVFCASAMGGTLRGWRSDWSGRYPEAKPTLTWSQQKGVLWKVAVPWGNATPVVVGDKVFFSSEQMTLVCASLKDGSIAWKKSVSLTDAFSPEERAKAGENSRKAAEINKEMAPIKKQMREVGRKLRRDRQNKELRAKMGELRKKEAALGQKLRPFQKFSMPPTHGTNGYASPTAVSDGKHVYVLYGPGLAACYDLDGNRKWLKMVERPQHNWGHCASPVLVDGILVVHVVNVFGLDAATGKQRWKAPSKAHWGSPIPARIGGVGTVVTTNGEIVRASDGKVLAKGLYTLTYNSPVLHEGVAYAIDNGNAVALRLPKAAGESLKPQMLWKVKVKRDRYYGSPLVHDGIVYAITRANTLTALDIKDGKKLYEQRLKELGGGTVYPSMVLAGKHLFVSIDNGTTLVVEPGKQFKLAGKNKLEGFRATPVFAGDRMLVRTLTGLFCIGAK